MPFTKEQKLEFARRVREGGLSERIAVEAEIENDRKKRPGYDGLTAPPRTDWKTLSMENHRAKFVYKISDDTDDDRAALERFTTRRQSRDAL